MKKIDLNSDIGESLGVYKIGLDEEIVKYISSANIACGWHAGDPMIMEKTVGMSLKRSVSIGAHPGFMDIMGFGRRDISVTEGELKSYIRYQLGAIMAIAKSKGTRVNHIKPHGSMYNLATRDRKIARAIAESVYSVDENIILVGLANSYIIEEGRSVGLRVASEFFADREYDNDGRLVSRSIDGAIIEDENIAVERVLDLVNTGKIRSIDGKELELRVDTICVHGDNPKAIEFVKKLYQSLQERSIEIVPMNEFL